MHSILSSEITISYFSFRFSKYHYWAICEEFINDGCKNTYVIELGISQVMLILVTLYFQPSKMELVSDQKWTEHVSDPKKSHF